MSSREVCLMTLFPEQGREFQSLELEQCWQPCTLPSGNAEVDVQDAQVGCTKSGACACLTYAVRTCTTLQR